MVFDWAVDQRGSERDMCIETTSSLGQKAEGITFLTFHDIS